MDNDIRHIIEKDSLDKTDIISLLNCEMNDEGTALFTKANNVKRQYVGNKVYFRGLIELSNICAKDCYYCGIRSGNKNVRRYELTDEEVFDAVEYAWKNRFGSIVLQSGERNDVAFVERIDRLLREIKQRTNNEIGITLSCGEQSKETYARWFESGAHRYLLRIETSNKDLYSKIHRQDTHHRYEDRLQALHDLAEIGYQVGTGVMIGLPEQTTEDLANDLLFFHSIDVHMVGMGPYIEHKDTPMYNDRGKLLSLTGRFELTLKMIAVLRLLMNDINIAATTALQAINPVGRELAIQAGANIIMPNLTDAEHRRDYLLYDNKPCLDEDTDACKHCLEVRLIQSGAEIGYGEWGDSKHFQNRK